MLKKFIPKKRSNINSMSATVITGNASTSRNEVTRVIHVKSGIRISDMPGARILTIVTMKLKAAASEAMPSTCRLTAQKSMPWPGLKSLPVIGAYPNQPALGAPPKNQLSFRRIAPARNVQ